MDILEKFILEHRSDFDTEIPDLKVWSGVVRGLEKRSPIRIVVMKRLGIAASITLLLTAGGIVGAYLASKGQAVKSLSDLHPEYVEMERYYNSQISQKLAQLSSFRQDGYVKADLQELDAIYEELKKDLQNVPPGSEEQVIQAMINNYQTKVDILERVLEKVQTTNQTNLKIEGNEVSL